MFPEPEAALKLESRRRIYELICRSPGLHFRELQRKSGFGDGHLKYHLDVLTRLKLISSFRHGILLRFFPSHLGAEERALMGFLRQRRFRKIILLLFSRGSATHGEIARELNVSPSTVSWYLKSLHEHGIVANQRLGRESAYYLTRREPLQKLIREYKESFLDRLVDGFVDMWE